MPWKLDEDGQIVVQDGNPLFVHPDGREEPFNGDSTLVRIGELKEEAKKHRQKYSTLKTKVQPLLDASDIEDVGEFLTQARESIELVKSYKEKGNPSAEEIEKVKKSVAELFESRIQEKEKAHQREVETLKTQNEDGRKLRHKMLVKSQFEQSDFLRDKTYVIPEMAYASFGKQFVVEEKGPDEDPVIFALDYTGEKIFSLNSSKYAEPQEAIEILVRSHPKANQMLRTTPGGGGAGGGEDRKPFTGKTIAVADKNAASRNLDKIASGEVVVVSQ